MVSTAHQLWKSSVTLLTLWSAIAFLSPGCNKKQVYYLVYLSQTKKQSGLSTILPKQK